MRNKRATPKKVKVYTIKNFGSYKGEAIIYVERVEDGYVATIWINGYKAATMYSSKRFKRKDFK